MMEAQFASGEFVKQGICVEACGLGDLPHPFGTAFELSEAGFSLSNLILPGGAGLSIGGPGRRMAFDGSKLGGLGYEWRFGGLPEGCRSVELWPGRSTLIARCVATKAVRREGAQPGRRY